MTHRRLTLAGEAGAAGANGKSAYELAVEKGYTGTLEEWLASLTGATGATGAAGATGATGATGAAGADGSDGADGRNGRDGKDGKDGKDGNGIAGIAKTATNGNVDTYTISFTDGTSAAFTVTNGKDGVGVAFAAFNEKGELVFTLTDGTIINLGPLPGGAAPAIEVVPGDKGGASAAVPIALGSAAVSLASLLGWLIPLLRRKTGGQ